MTYIAWAVLQPANPKRAHRVIGPRHFSGLVVRSSDPANVRLNEWQKTTWKLSSGANFLTSPVTFRRKPSMNLTNCRPQHSKVPPLFLSNSENIHNLDWYLAFFLYRFGAPRPGYLSYQDGDVTARSHQPNGQRRGDAAARRAERDGRR